MRFVLLAIVLLLNGCSPAPTAHGPLPHEVYVWQRRWTPAVRSGIERAAPHVAGFTVLIGEVGLRDARWQTATAEVDYAHLATAGRPVGLGLRIGTYTGKFSRDAAPLRAAADLLHRSLDRAQRAHLVIAEVQLDFDCPSVRLAGYTTWVKAFQTEFPATPIAITALPDWLGQRAFPHLAQTAGRYVLQVHAVPTSLGAPPAICDDRAARRAIALAGRIGVPFRVALPTYGCEILADAQGKILGLRAEDSPSTTGVTRRAVLRSDPVALATLVHDLQAKRPPALQGILWYRLPIDGERLNWRWNTLAAILEGRLPRPTGTLMLQSSDTGVLDVVLENRGEADWFPPAEFPLPATTVAGDGVNGFQIDRLSNGRWRLRNLNPHGVVRPGERLVCGWVREATSTPLSFLQP